MIPNEKLWATRTRRLRKEMRRIVERDRQNLGKQFNCARVRIDNASERKFNLAESS